MSSVLVRPLRDVEMVDVADVGGKAASLGELLSMGVRVPDGVVLTNCGRTLSTDSSALIDAAVVELGDGPFAVRSSGIAEDGTERSFAGMFSSMLEVRPEEIPAAVNLVLASADTERVAGYGESTGAEMAVIIQAMIPAISSGVALTADPIDGNRQACVVTAVQGTAERLVSGEAAGDEWVVANEHAPQERRRTEGSIHRSEVQLVADTARRIAEARGAPQDIEWAIDADGELWILQARPMTALPPEVSWDPPAGGAFSRTFRLGEWISGPVTPLFESWLLPAIEGGLHDTLQEWVGLRSPKPYHVVVNGWAFFSLNWLSPKASLSSLPGVLLRLVRSPRRVAGARPETARFSIPVYEQEWRQELLPAYRAAVQQAESQVEGLPATELLAMIDDLGRRAGVYFASIAALSGATYKLEMSLAQAYRRNIDKSADGSYLPLLAGFSPPAKLGGHAVASLDWFFEPAPETGDSETSEHGRVVAAREAAERDAFDALAARPKRLRRFQHILAEAQRLVPIREEQVSELTLPWPVMRRAVLRIGETLAQRGIIAASEDIFYLTHDEVISGLGGASLTVDTDERRVERDEQSRLVPPMMAGQLNPIARRMWASYTASIGGTPSVTAIVSGGPASPGKATGVVRVITGPEAFHELLSGEVLVAPVTAPAWTPLFHRAAAVVTDVGSVAAHASIIAREYGIPAVVGCGDATARLQTGMRVTVDGNTGNIELASAVQEGPAR